jgi:hypothetical protein
MQGLIASTTIPSKRVDVRLSEAGRFASKSTVSASLNKRQTVDSPLSKRIVAYVVSRQNNDGGYAFAQGLDSNAQDTYYGLAVLSILCSLFPHLDRTIGWLRDFDVGSIYSYYYIGKALTLCNKPLGSRFRGYVESAVGSGKYFGNVDVYVEVSSEFESTLMFLELASILKMSPEGEEARRWLLRYRNKDGGFGAYGHSNIDSTYHAIASLSLLKANRMDLNDTVRFVRECEQSHGGFTVVARSVTPFMEHTYCGVKALDLLGESCRFPSQTMDFVLKCQRRNGGFARSDLGISTFENTFQAVNVLRTLGFL